MFPFINSLFLPLSEVTWLARKPEICIWTQFGLLHSVSVLNLRKNCPCHTLKIHQSSPSVPSPKAESLQSLLPDKMSSLRHRMNSEWKKRQPTQIDDLQDVNSPRMSISSSFKVAVAAGRAGDIQRTGRSWGDTTEISNNCKSDICLGCGRMDNEQKCLWF